MSAVANIVLQDAQATPVSHTFIPLGPDANNVWWFEDQSAASPIGYNRISLQLVRPGNPSAGEDSAKRVFRVKIGLHTPTLEVISNSTVSGIIPAPTISYINRFNAEFIIPERSTLQNRKDARKYAQFLMADTQVVAMVESLQSVF